jgi:large subunit ribosomal protein L37Ae
VIIMARTKKVGITGRFGARYGRKAKRSVKIIEENMKKNHTCPQCDRPGVKRVSAGIWKCRKCGAVFTGGAYMPNTPMGKTASRNIKRIVGGL